MTTAPDMTRVLVVPAAGRGSRLGGSLPKALAEVGGKPMLAWLTDLYRDHVQAIVVVAHPGGRQAIAHALDSLTDLAAAVVVQAEPIGMLDAVLLGCEAAARWSPDRIWVTWCDQVAVHPSTVSRLAAQEDDSGLALPIVTREDPYIHFDRDRAGRITAVRQRREGDAMPPRGDSDMGLFSLSRHAAQVDLPAFAAAAAGDRGTGERNFLPFIPWLAACDAVLTIEPTDDMEAVGVNTPDDLARVEAYLKTR